MNKECNKFMIVLIRLTCSSQGGNPWPKLSFVINNTGIEAERLEPLVYGHEAVLSLKVTREHANVEMACVAENDLSPLPVSSNHQKLGVKSMKIERLVFTFTNVNTVFYLKLARVMSTSRDRRSSSITSRRRSSLVFLTSPILRQISQSLSEVILNNLSQLKLLPTISLITDQSGNEVVTELAPSPIMKTSVGFSTRMSFRFTVGDDMERVSVSCTASNEANSVTDELTVNIKSER